MSTTKPLVLVERDGPLATLTLNRPEKRNAMNTEMTREAKSVIVGLAGADDLRVLIIEGAGGVFSAGADVVEMGALREDNARDFISNLHSLIRSVREFPHSRGLQVPGLRSGRGTGVDARLRPPCRGGGYEVRHARGAGGRALRHRGRVVRSLLRPGCSTGLAIDGQNIRRPGGASSGGSFSGYARHPTWKKQRKKP